MTKNYDDSDLVSDIEDNFPTEEFFLRAPGAVWGWNVINHDDEL